MGLYKEDLVEYIGVSKYIPQNLISKNEFNIEEIVEINDECTEIDEIVKVSVKAKCNNVRLIKTPIGTSLDGIRLTGNKAFVSSELGIRIEYITKENQNKIYSLKVDKQLYSSVILEFSDSIKRSNVANMFIEDILARKIGRNEVLIVIYGIVAIE